MKVTYGTEEQTVKVEDDGHVKTVSIDRDVFGQFMRPLMNLLKTRDARVTFQQSSIQGPGWISCEFKLFGPYPQYRGVVASAPNIVEALTKAEAEMTHAILREKP